MLYSFKYDGKNIITKLRKSSLGNLIKSLKNRLSVNLPSRFVIAESLNLFNSTFLKMYKYALNAYCDIYK